MPSTALLLRRLRRGSTTRSRGPSPRAVRVIGRRSEGRKTNLRVGPRGQISRIAEISLIAARRRRIVASNRLPRVALPSVPLPRVALR